MDWFANRYVSLDCVNAHNLEGMQPGTVTAMKCDFKGGWGMYYFT